MHKVPRILFVVPLALAAAMAQAPPRLSVSSGSGSEKTPPILESSSPQATVKPAALRPAAAAANVPFNDPEFQTEQQLLLLANQSRKQAGAPALMLNAGLSHAARIHAQAMLEARQLSHRFDGEASLPERLAAMTDIQLDQEGENVALDYSAEGGHQHLMLSPPHRANLLNPAYNVVGLGVVRSGDRLYIVQDFGHALPNYSPAEVKDRIATAVNQMRRQSGLSDLQRKDVLNEDAAACSMTQADKLGTPAVQQLSRRFTVLSFTSLHPETLPAGADHAIASRNLSTFSIGACYGKTDTYPTGMYWVVLSLD